MRWWCAGEFKQRRRRDSVEKTSADPALLRILLLGDGSGALWKLYGVPRRPLSPWPAAALLSPWPAAALLSPWPAAAPLSPWLAAAPPGVFHGNFGLTDADAEDVARALKTLTGIADLYVAWESRRTDAPPPQANWGMLRNAFSPHGCAGPRRVGVFVSNGPKRLYVVCLQTTYKGTIGATLLDNAVQPCSHFGLTDAEDIAKLLTGLIQFVSESCRTDAPTGEDNSAMLPNALCVFVSNCPKRLTGMVHLYVAWECRHTDALAREANSTMLGPVFVSNCPKRLHVKCTVRAALLHNARPLCCHFYLTLRDALSIRVPSCSSRAQVCLHTGSGSQNFGVSLAADFTRTTRAALLDGTHPLEDDLRGQVSYPEPACEKICAPSIRKWNSFKKVILILVIISLITGVDSSSTGTSSMKNFCPKRDPTSYFMSQQRNICPIIEIRSAHWRHSKRVAPGPSQQAQQPRETHVELTEVISTLAAYFLLFVCCRAPWISVKNLVLENGRIHRFLWFIRIEPVSMWRYTLLASINFYASMMAYGIAYGLAPESNESTLLKNFTWLQFTITIANALYCLASFLVLMLLLYRERTVFQEANMVRSLCCSIVGTILILIIHGVLCAAHPSNFMKIFLFEKITSMCIILMFLFRWFTMEPTGINFLFNLCAIVSGVILLCIGEANKWYKWGVVFVGLLGRSFELITWTIWFFFYEGRNPVTEQVNDG